MIEVGAEASAHFLAQVAVGGGDDAGRETRLGFADALVLAVLQNAQRLLAVQRQFADLVEGTGCRCQRPRNSLPLPWRRR